MIDCDRHPRVERRVRVLEDDLDLRPHRRAAPSRTWRSTSTPSKCTDPDVGSISRRMQRPVVDFPQPDSPTSPSVSPRSTEKLTPETAWTSPTLCWNRPARIGNSLTRSVTSRTSCGSTGTGAPARVDGRHGVRSGAPSASSRSRRCAPRSGTRTSGRHRRGGAPAARCCTTPGTSAVGHRGWNAQPGGRKISDGGWPLIRCSRLFLSDRRSRRGSDASSPSRVRVARLVEDLVDGADLHLPAGVHHQHAVGDAGDDAEVVRDQHDRRLGAVLDALEHLEHLRLDRHVERGRRLVGDEQRRGRSRSPSRSSPAGASRRSTRAGTGRRAASGSGCPTMSSSSITCARRSELARCRWCTVIASAIWLPTVCTGLSAVSASWKIIAIFEPRTLLELLLGQAEQLLAAEEDLAGDRRRARQQAEDRHRRHGLARAGLADDAERLVVVHVEATPCRPRARSRRRSWNSTVRSRTESTGTLSTVDAARCRPGSSSTGFRSSARLRHVSASPPAGRTRRAGRRRGSSRASTVSRIISPGNVEQVRLRGADVALGVREHAAPRRLRRLHAEAEERQRRLGDDRGGDARASRSP